MSQTLARSREMQPSDTALVRGALAVLKSSWPGVVRTLLLDLLSLATSSKNAVNKEHHSAQTLKEFLKQPKIVTARIFFLTK